MTLQRKLSEVLQEQPQLYRVYFSQVCRRGMSPPEMNIVLQFCSIKNDENLRIEQQLLNSPHGHILRVTITVYRTGERPYKPRGIFRRNRTPIAAT